MSKTTFLTIVLSFTYSLLSGCGGDADVLTGKKPSKDDDPSTSCCTAPDDPLFKEQWHLHSTGNQYAFSDSPAAEARDIHLGDLHEQGYLGRGVFVAVVDDGLDIDHEDLKNNIAEGQSYNYLTGTNDPSKSPEISEDTAMHGTAVAGIIAAEAFNNKGGRGIAPSAKLLGFNLIETGGESFIHGWKETHGGSRTKNVLVVNESYGVSSTAPQSPNSEHQAFESHLNDVMSTLNQGRGMFLSKSAGNSFYYVNDFSWQGKEYRYQGKPVHGVVSAHVRESGHPKLSANISGTELESSSFYHTVVAALGSKENTHLASYSSVGPSVWFSAPGGEYGTDSPAIITTDLTGCQRGYTRASHPELGCNYTSTFNGTSAAAPMVSGVAALLFAANDQLTWRDVRHILLSTATKIDPDFQAITLANGFEAVPAWQTNNAKFSFHHWYGFGKIDAKAAVTLATNSKYQPLPPFREEHYPADAPNPNIDIPNDVKRHAEKTITVSDSFTIEAVQLTISIDHLRDADLAIQLISPSGTTSMLLQPQSLLIEDLMDGKSATNFNNTLLQSNAFYGEEAKGTWTVKVTDTNQGEFVFFAHSEEELTDPNKQLWKITSQDPKAPATLGNVSLTIYGH